MISIEEKKDHLIVKHKDFKSLPKEKQEWLINYFKSRDNPPNMTIDWLKLNNYDIEDIYKATLEKSKTALKKAVKKAGIEGLKEGEDYIELDISKYTNTYKAYVPLHWEASKLIASSKVGRCEGKWCTAYQKDSSHWVQHTKTDKAVLIYLVDTSESDKYAIKYFINYPKIDVWDPNDRKINLNSFEEITHINVSIFHNYSSILHEAFQKIRTNNIKMYYKTYKDYLEGKKYVKDRETLKKIIDDCPDKSKYVKKLKIGINSLKNLFNYTNLEGYDISEWDVSNVEDMSFMFRKSSFNGDISNWDVSNVKNMSGMFEGSDFNGDISKWNVSKVEDMSFMFSGSKFNGDISQWDVSKVKDMFYMFTFSEFNGDISNWNVSNVQNMGWMFANNLKFNGDISRWDVSNVMNMDHMFYMSKFNGDISQWNVSNVTNMSGMFADSEFNGDISNWDVSNVGDMSYMFHASKFTGDLSQWNVSNVENMSRMFESSEFNGDISNWDVSNVENMDRMFYKSKFSGDISKWNVANVKKAEDIFYESPLEKKYPNGLEDLIKEQKRKKETIIKKFLNTYFRRSIMVHIEEKKDHLIVKHKDFKSLPKEKQEWLINYFKSRDNPPEMRIDWLKLNSYNIEEIYKATLEKTKTGLKKAVKKAGIEGLEEGKDYVELDISQYTNTYRAYVPLHWEASKLIASSRIGGCEGKWCTAYQKDSFHWHIHTHIEFKGVLIYLISIKNPEKYAILYFLRPSGNLEDFYVWDSENNEIKPKGLYERTGIDVNIFQDYHSYLEKVYDILQDHKIKFFNKKYKEYVQGEKYVESLEVLSQIVNNCPDPANGIKKLRIGFSDLSYLFQHKDLLGYDISEWDVSRVTSMAGMFHYAKGIGDISNWDVSNVENMSHMFSYSDFDGDISKWNVKNVKKADHIFTGSPLEERYPNGLEDLKEEQQRKKENIIKKFLDNSIWRDV